MKAMRNRPWRKWIPGVVLWAWGISLFIPPRANLAQPGIDLDRYSHRFTFARIRYGGRFSERSFGMPPWAHDYPRGGRHLMKILSEISAVRPNPDEVILTFDDPRLFKYPFAYLCEVGFMNLSEREIEGMRQYLLRGGFLLVDDFRGEGALENFRWYVRRAFPDLELEELTITHPIFNCFFSLKTLDVQAPYGEGKPVFYGLSDKTGRLMMIVNYNNDLSEFWEWSDDPFAPIEQTNEAYKFGVNYIIYALTH